MTDGDTRNFYVEIAHRGDRRVEDEVDACLAGLAEAHLIDGVESVLDVHVEHVPNAYVLQDPNYHTSRTVLLDYLAKHHVLSTGGMATGSIQRWRMRSSTVAKAAQWLSDG